MVTPRIFNSGLFSAQRQRKRIVNVIADIGVDNDQLRRRSGLRSTHPAPAAARIVIETAKHKDSASRTRRFFMPSYSSPSALRNSVGNRYVTLEKPLRFNFRFIELNIESRPRRLRNVRLLHHRWIFSKW